MRLIVGLGNPGIKYAATKHNLGFRAVDLLAERMGIRLTQSRNQSLYAIGRWQDEQYLLVKPLTYMNLSGRAVRSWIGFYRLPLDRMLVIYDDVALDLGRVRLREEGSSGGHRGTESLIKSLGSQAFPRLRLGIGPQPPGIDSADFVLQNFQPQEKDTVERVLAVVPEIVMCWSHEGLTQAMNRYNAPSL